MNRRELIQKSALLGAAACVGSISDLAKAAGPATTSSKINALSPLPAPAGGNLPVAFVLGKGAVVLDFAGPLEVFDGATTKDGRPLFVPYMVAETKNPVTVGGGMKIVPDHDFKSAPQPKVIVVPAMDLTDGQMYEWIRTASKATDVTMSVCNGAYVLAQTGLLDGKSATCHHGGFLMFASMYPKVHLNRGARFVEEGNLASAGGVSSGIDLALRVVERYVGYDLTAQVVDGMEYQGKGWLDPNSNEIYAKLPAFTEEKPICPGCLMELSDRSIKSNHKGKNYYFCSTSDKELFDKNTGIFDRFLAEDAAHSSHPNS
jgi:putative intracellular protease/amidase/YHS domain-containing protein